METFRMTELSSWILHGIRLIKFVKIPNYAVNVHIYDFIRRSKDIQGHLLINLSLLFLC